MSGGHEEDPDLDKKKTLFFEVEKSIGLLSRKSPPKNEKNPSVKIVLPVLEFSFSSEFSATHSIFFNSKNSLLPEVSLLAFSWGKSFK